MKYKIIASIVVIVVLIVTWALMSGSEEGAAPEQENVEVQLQ